MIHVEPDLIGKEFLLSVLTVTPEDIRTFADAVGDPNPVYRDVEAARKAGFPNIIAPPMFCMRLREGRMVPDIPLPDGYVTLHAGQEFEFREALVAGETYRVTAKIAEVYEKTGRSGPLGVIVREVAIKDKDDETVILLRERQIARSPERKI